MENLKEMQIEFENLKNQNKIVVEVKQNKKISNYWLDEKTNILQLMAFLYNREVIKANIKMRYSYNYSDLQEITFSQSYENYDGSITVTSYKFYNIPSNLGYLDIYKLNKKLESEVK